MSRAPYLASGSDDRCLYAAAWSNGWVHYMEDRHCVVLDLIPSSPESPASTDLTPEQQQIVSTSPFPRLSYFGIFDGHAGEKVAQFASENLHKHLRDALIERPPDIPHASISKYFHALQQAFLKTDEAYPDKDLVYVDSFNAISQGSTAITVVLGPDNYVYVANAGDSRAIVSRNGVGIHLSHDHKASDPLEERRIENAHGFVKDGRINGNLAPGRALGDYQYKLNKTLPPEKQILTADPQLSYKRLDLADEFIVVASDGTWDSLPSQTVVDRVREKIAKGRDLRTTAEHLAYCSMASDISSFQGRPVGRDNVTCIIIALLLGRTQEEWFAEIKRRVARRPVPKIYRPPKAPYYHQYGAMQAGVEYISERLRQWHQAKEQREKELQESKQKQELLQKSDDNMKNQEQIESTMEQVTSEKSPNNENENDEQTPILDTESNNNDDSTPSSNNQI